MNDHLKQRIQRRLETLSDDRGYQILDYIEFLDTRYGDKQAAAAASNPFTKFTEAVEDRLRAGRVSASAIAETVGLMNKAAGVLNGAMKTAQNMASELASVPEQFRQSSAPAQPAGTKPASPAPEASSPAHDTKAPGSGEEKL
jgi:hypothetical protein